MINLAECHGKIPSEGFKGQESNKWRSWRLHENLPPKKIDLL
jgi:hypothetical protein